MLTKSNFNGMQEITELWNLEYTPGMVSGETIEKVKEILELNERDMMSLQNLRDFVVMMLDAPATEARAAGDWVAFDKVRDCSSAVTHIIDSMMRG